VGQGVGAALRGHRGRQGRQQLRIQDRRLRDEAGAADRHLLVPLRIGDHRHPRDLGAGPGGGRDRVERGDGRGHLQAVAVAAQRRGARQPRRHRLRGVDRAAAAETDHGAAALLAGERHRLLHDGDGGIGVHPVEQGERDARPPQHGRQALGDAGRGDAGIGHDQMPGLG
jgi:hypothetical protein